MGAGLAPEMAVVGHERVVGAVEMEDGDGAFRFDLAGDAGARDRRDGGDAVGPFGSQAVAHHPAVGESGGVHAFGVDVGDGREVVEDLGEVTHVVGPVAGSQADVPVEQSTHAGAVRVGDEEAVTIGGFAEAADPDHHGAVGGERMKGQNERGGFVGVVGPRDVEEVGASGFANPNRAGEVAGREGLGSESENGEGGQEERAHEGTASGSVGLGRGDQRQDTGKWGVESRFWGGGW